MKVAYRTATYDPTRRALTPLTSGQCVAHRLALTHTHVSAPAYGVVLLGSDYSCPCGDDHEATLPLGVLIPQTLELAGKTGLRVLGDPASREHRRLPRPHRPHLNRAGASPEPGARRTGQQPSVRSNRTQRGAQRATPAVSRRGASSVSDTHVA